jgi:hypothetical protein
MAVIPKLLSFLIPHHLRKGWLLLPLDRDQGGFQSKYKVTFRAAPVEGGMKHAQLTPRMSSHVGLFYHRRFLSVTP